MKINNSSYHIVYPYFLSLFIFTLSLLLLPLYINGDQQHYIRVYQELENKNLLEGFLYYNLALDSKEIVHFFLSWILSPYLQKDIFVSISNAILAFFTVKLLILKRINSIIIFFTIVFNFYFVVLYTGAERLKFGFLFFIISIYYLHSIKKLTTFSILAILSHAQMIIIYLSMLFKYYLFQIVKIFKYLKISKFALLIIFFSLIIFIVLSEQIIKKATGYFEIHSVTELFQWAIFFIMSLYYSKNKVEVIAIFIPFSFAIILFGGMRINILCYFVFLYYALPYNRGLNFGVISTTIYFTIKSFFFVQNIIEYGDGFKNL